MHPLFPQTSGESPLRFHCALLFNIRIHFARMPTLILSGSLAENAPHHWILERIGSRSFERRGRKWFRRRYVRRSDTSSRHRHRLKYTSS
jgi:hypothetical protein